MSWIHRDDLVRLCLACLEDERYAGVINAVAPEPVSNRDLARALGRAVRRPALLPAPPLGAESALSEAPPAETVRQRGGAGFWPWLSAVLVLGWLATALLWWRQRRR